MNSYPDRYNTNTLKQRMLTVRSKVTTAAASLVDPGKKEREELKTRIDKLAAELNKKEKERQWKKKRTPTNSP